jgi:hypothetical protein
MDEIQHDLPMVSHEHMMGFLDANLTEFPGPMHFTVCRACREIYGQVEDEEIRKKLRYISMLTNVITHRMERLRRGWLKTIYPRREEYDRIMSGK